MRVPRPKTDSDPIFLPRRREIERLSAAHAIRAGCGGKLTQHRDHALRRLRRVRQHRKRQRLQRIASEDRGGLVEGDMHGRLAAAQRVVVHRRQVVVDQRVGMDQFDRDCGSAKRLRRGAAGMARGMHQ